MRIERREISFPLEIMPGTMQVLNLTHYIPAGAYVSRVRFLYSTRQLKAELRHGDCVIADVPADVRAIYPRAVTDWKSHLQLGLYNRSGEALYPVAIVRYSVCVQ